MPTTAEHIGHRILRAMQEKNVGPTEVAAHFGVKPPSVNGWTNDGRIAKRHLSKLVTYFGKPLAYWIDGTDDGTVVNEQQPPAYLPKMLATVRETRTLIDQLGEALDCCSLETRTAVASLLHQYALSPKPGAVADALVMFLERCKHATADNPFAGARPTSTSSKKL